MPFINEENIGKISFISSIVIIVLLTATLGFVFVQDIYSNFREDFKRVEVNYTAPQKNRLMSDVNIQARLIDGRRRRSETELKNDAKNRVYEAHAVALNLYQKNRGNNNPEEIQSVIKEALRPVRFHDGNGYFFIRSVKGVAILYPPDPEREGLNIKLRPDKYEIDLFGEMVQIVQDKGEGFIKYQWPKPDIDEAKRFEKIAFVKYFEPYDWAIGSGNYIDKMQDRIQQSIIDHLNSITPDLNYPDYIFIYKLHNMNGGDEFATMLVNPNRPDLIGKKIADSYKDAKGKLFRKEMLQGIRDKGEAFVTYWYKKPGTDEMIAKLSYFKYYPEWEWIVAKGTYLDSLEKNIAHLQDNLRHEIKKTIQYFVYFIIIIGIIFLCMGYFFSKGINSIFQGYKRTQKEQKDELEKVNAALQIKATTDPLTTLYNRGYFNHCLKNEMERSKRYGSALSLIIFDIDRFKQVNDTFGHLSGDIVLKELSFLCLAIIRDSDILARWGGEEFIILVPENDKAAIMPFAEKLRTLIEKHPFSIKTQVTCSFGVVQYIEEESKDDFIKRADQAMYKAKEEGRNKVVFL
ncbi:MAG: cache domain-containing protein [Deltaproteobacteria bacterium]|uniref:sensor domain-containing diguanylate cyclase n=1 Tax=Desulfobacula sp. TaxID=2593537 RepID=UPI00198F4276|nr:cache domain-containing protein [Candidatus Desulfobacula maris]MBL6994894.1 cache domain-containing protein [Desulfobacula sp.]